MLMTRLTDFAGAHRPRDHRNIGGVLVSTEIIQLIPRPADTPTDFPTIAFRSVVHEPAAVYTDVTADHVAELEKRET
jgi:hypothetical protein